MLTKVIECQLYCYVDLIERRSFCKLRELTRSSVPMCEWWGFLKYCDSTYPRNHKRLRYPQKSICSFKSTCLSWISLAKFALRDKLYDQKLFFHSNPKLSGEPAIHLRKSCRIECRPDECIFDHFISHL